jgi:hypothetical protein
MKQRLENRALIANIHRKDLGHKEKVKGVAAYYESQGFPVKKHLNMSTS